MVEQGFDKGFGSMLSLKLFFREETHPGVPVISQLQPYAACAQNLFPANTTDYAWFKAVACMDDGQTSYNQCVREANLPPAQASAIDGCINNKAKSSALVKTMNTAAANNPGPAWPWVIVERTALPEPDMHNDNVKPFIKAVCNAYTGTKAPACGSLVNATNV